MKFPKIIAEIGCNHKGDMTIAKEMIMTAATYCKADVANTASCKNGAMSLVLSIPHRCGISPRPRRYARCILTLSKCLRLAI